MQVRRVAVTFVLACTVLGGSTASADIDWRTKGVVTPVKNQGALDASWAFATAGAVEAWVAIQGAPLTSLSAQELVDCVGVAGGTCASPISCQKAPCALNFAASNGLCSLQSYPYTGEPGSCQSASCTAVAKLDGWTRLMGEAQIAGALNQGPVVVRLEIGDANSVLPAFQYFTGPGILGPIAHDDSVTQWVLLVGYTSSYFIAKNSWGTSWGAGGYIKLMRGANALGLANNAYSPFVSSGHGSCALTGSICQDMTEAECTIAGGFYHGDQSCAASCDACGADTGLPSISVRATPRPAKKGAGTITFTASGVATDDCGLDPSSAGYTITDSYDPDAPVGGLFTINPDHTFSFTVDLAATRTTRRAHVYKISVTVSDFAGHVATATVAIPIT